MSHLISTQTGLQILTYLEKALKKLNITYQRKESQKVDLILPQFNGYHPEFVWNQDSYQLVADVDFWRQTYNVDTFLEKVTHQYSLEYLVAKSHKGGYQVIDFERNFEGEATLELERWNLLGGF